MPRGRPRKTERPHPPCFYESHGAYYHVVKGVWHPLGTELPAALEAYGRRVDPRSREGELNPLIDAVFERMKARKVNPLSKSTIKQYTTASAKLKHIARSFTHPAQVKQKDAAMLKVLLAATPNMANRVISFARQVFADFVEHQLIDSNPFLGIKRHHEAKRTRLIKQEEWDAIYNLAAPRLKCVMDGLYLTDQRIDDVLALDERNIFDDGAGIYFKQKKTGKELIVAWNPQLREWVARCRALHGKVVKVDFKVEGKPRPLFKTRHGRRPAYRTVYDQWVRTVKLAGVEDCNLHDNRAMSATDAQRQGLDAQKLLGHTDATTTRTYLRGREIDIVQGPQMKRSA